MVKKYWISIIGALVILVLLTMGIYCDFEFLSDTLLAITALIILWYTWETFLIRKSNQDLLQKSRRPAVGYVVFTNEKQPVDTRFRIINHSEYPVAALIKCVFKIDDKVVPNIWPAYNGKEYWNVQFKEMKEGHFNWLELYSKIGIFTDEELEEIKKSKYEGVKRKITKDLILSYDFKKPPVLKMSIEIFCVNEFGEKMYYPPAYYEFDPYRIGWVAHLTSTIPYWEYDAKPKWIENKIT